MKLPFVVAVEYDPDAVESTPAKLGVSEFQFPSPLAGGRIDRAERPILALSRHAGACHSAESAPARSLVFQERRSRRFRARSRRTIRVPDRRRAAWRPYRPHVGRHPLLPSFEHDGMAIWSELSRPGCVGERSLRSNTFPGLQHVKGAVPIRHHHHFATLASDGKVPASTVKWFRSQSCNSVRSGLVVPFQSSSCREHPNAISKQGGLGSRLCNPRRSSQDWDFRCPIERVVGGSQPPMWRHRRAPFGRRGPCLAAGLALVPDGVDRQIRLPFAGSYTSEDGRVGQGDAASSFTTSVAEWPAL